MADIQPGCPDDCWAVWRHSPGLESSPWGMKLHGRGMAAPALKLQAGYCSAYMVSFACLRAGTETHPAPVCEVEEDFGKWGVVQLRVQPLQGWLCTCCQVLVCGSLDLQGGATTSP